MKMNVTSVHVSFPVCKGVGALLSFFPVKHLSLSAGYFIWSLLQLRSQISFCGLAIQSPVAPFFP